jgi:hypothetical protein
MKIRTDTTRKIFFLVDNSELAKMERDEEKFNKAKGLQNYDERIRKKYQKDWRKPDEKTKQLSVASYLINTLAIRPGSRRNVNTFGCCTLLVKHITLAPRNKKVTLSFPGNCSVSYKKTISVPTAVFTNLQQLKEGKSPTKEIFDKINATTLNKYLRESAGTDEVSSKIIRTYRGCVEFEEKLEEYSKLRISGKMKYYRALRDAAKLLNHKRRMGTELNLDCTEDYYVDPRITVAWCKRFRVPIEDVFSKKRIRKFKWAMSTPRDYKFNLCVWIYDNS